MKCEKCKAELVDGAKFCMFCGAKVGTFCPKCKTKLPDVAQFCFNCGTEVRQQSVQKTESTVNIFDILEMERLANIKENVEQSSMKGAPVWDETPSGVCDCAVGECDCDGSIWN